MLEAGALQVDAGGRTILALDSLVLRAGEFCAVIGPNGAGKSTLLQAVAGGVVRPRAGEVRIEGRALAQWPVRELADRRCWLPQRVELAWDYRVSEVIALACWQLPVAERGAVLAAIRSDWELDAFWDRPCNALSGGEQRRVHLARSVAQVWPRLQRGQPALLLLDEPIAHLDPAGELWALRRLQALVAQGAALLCVLHDVNLAARHAGRLLALRGGRPLADGAPAATLNAALLRSLYDVPFVGLASGDGLPWFVPQSGGLREAVS